VILLVSRHFEPKTYQDHQTGASAEVSRGHFGTGTELSRPPANIFCYNEERSNITRYYYYRFKEDH